MIVTNKSRKCNICVTGATRRRLGRIASSYFGLGEGEGAIGAVSTDALGAALAAGTTGAPGAGTAGAFGLTGGVEAEGWAVVCCFNNSLRRPVSRLVLCEYKIDNAKVSRKKIPVNQPVNFTRTLVVCAPKIFSVTPAPNAAPSPSLFGRCIKMTSSIKSATST